MPFALSGIAKVGLDGTLYDQVLDWVFALGLAPARFQKLSGYDLYFAMARGTEGAVALDMSKFFDTNYHYMVSCQRQYIPASWLTQYINHVSSLVKFQMFVCAGS